MDTEEDIVFDLLIEFLKEIPGEFLVQSISLKQARDIVKTFMERHDLHEE